MTMIQVGDAEIRRVEELAIISSMAMLTQDQALIEANRHWLMPHFLRPDGRRDFIFQSWILFVDGKVVVIDPCTGNGRPHMHPLFNRLDTPYIERFGATGIRPEQVDYVFCTHLHHDHCGWNTQLRDGRYVPTFPNARYPFVRREYERWDTRQPGHKPVDYNIGVFEQSVLPVSRPALPNWWATGIASRPASTSSLLTAIQPGIRSCTLPRKRTRLISQAMCSIIRCR